MAFGCATVICVFLVLMNVLSLWVARRTGDEKEPLIWFTLAACDFLIAHTVAYNLFAR